MRASSVIASEAKQSQLDQTRLLRRPAPIWCWTPRNDSVVTAVSIIGSTGSAGQQTLHAIQSAKGDFSVYALSCKSNISRLFNQIENSHFHLKKVAIYSAKAARALQKKIRTQKPKILTGKTGIIHIASDPSTKILVISMTGEEAVEPLLAGIAAQKNIVLVNKEAVVCHGEKIAKALKKSSARIIPADSEHSAIFQCLEERRRKNARLSGIARVDISQVEKIIIPCSGGPFFGKTRAEIKKVALSDALNHPRWNMGKKILIDSAALINKGLEVIEAHYLFGMPYEKIEVVAHPECLFHGAVFWKNGTVSALFHPADMRYPLKYALYAATHGTHGVKRSASSLQRKKRRRTLATARVWPKRENCSKEYVFQGFLKHFHLSKQDRHKKTEHILRKICGEMPDLPRVTFHPIDHQTFPAIRQAYEAGKAGGRAPQRYCRAYSHAAYSYLQRKTTFSELLDLNPPFL